MDRYVSSIEHVRSYLLRFVSGGWPSLWSWLVRFTCGNLQVSAAQGTTVTWDRVPKNTRNAQIFHNLQPSHYSYHSTCPVPCFGQIFLSILPFVAAFGAQRFSILCVMVAYLPAAKRPEPAGNYSPVIYFCV